MGQAESSNGKNVKPFQRRTDTEQRQAGDYFSAGPRRYYDQNFEVTVVKIMSGEYYVTDSPGEMIVTILGSCVAACIRDPEMGIGGMNHFLLPGDPKRAANASISEANRYGINAMENLINGIIKKGGRKNKLEVKLFGGGNVTASNAMIGDKNAEFVRDFVRTEGLLIESEDLGGTLPRRIHYFPETGKVMMRKLQRRTDLEIVKKEQDYERTLSKKPVEGDIELFD